MGRELEGDIVLLIGSVVVIKTKMKKNDDNRAVYGVICQIICWFVV